MKHLLIGMSLLCLAHVPAWAASPGQVVDSIVKTIALEKKSALDGTAFEKQEAAFQNEIQNAGLEQAWYEKQAELLSRYVEEARERVDALTAKKANLQRIEAELAGQLMLAVDELDAFVQKDLPFLPQERSDRLAFLKKTVGNYDLETAEKLRRVLQGLQAELEYGRQTSLGLRTVTIQGQERKVLCLRVGRMAYFALSADRTKAWLFRQGQGFSPLAPADVQVLSKACDMVKNQMVTSLSPLPYAEVSHAPLH